MLLTAVQVPLYGAAADIHKVGDLVMFQVLIEFQNDHLGFRKRQL